MGVGYTLGPQESHRRPFHVVQRLNPTLDWVGNTMEPTPRRGRFTTFVTLLGATVTGRLQRFEISEHSMHPTLKDGEWILASSKPSRLGPGDIVVFDHPSRPGFSLVKRITSTGPDGITVLGDAASVGSVDSTSFGPIDSASVTARVLARYRPLPPRLIR